MANRTKDNAFDSLRTQSVLPTFKEKKKPFLTEINGEKS